MKQLTIKPLTTARKIKVIVGDGVEGVFITDLDDNILFRIDDAEVPCDSLIDELETQEFTI